MTWTQSLTCLALLPILAGPVAANPPCRTCLKAPAKVIVRDEVKIIKVQEAFNFIHFVPTYLAQITPAPAYNVNVTVPPPPAAAAQQLQVTQSAASIYGYGVTQGNGYAAQPPQYAAPAAAPSDRLAMALEAINQRLCDLEKRAGVVPLPDPFNPPQRAAVRGQPGLRVLRTSCVVCHDASVAATKGKGFVIDLARMDATVALKCLEKIDRNQMPPPNNREGVVPLDDQQAGAAKDYLYGVLQQSKP